ncbi:hypothetical protein EVAR_17472_1 [Eumeta japonica]|uniref:Uncharacterized protein n=1 Tax=Eumeta variegata TaxID=151549 RepID=A0A4C1SEN6_EUMVA|nr:hypothetical protein EVAR_17472_1 [Eumeta japonica]
MRAAIPPPAQTARTQAPAVNRGASARPRTVNDQTRGFEVLDITLSNARSYSNAITSPANQAPRAAKPTLSVPRARDELEFCVALRLCDCELHEWAPVLVAWSVAAASMAQCRALV